MHATSNTTERCPTRWAKVLALCLLIAPSELRAGEAEDAAFVRGETTCPDPKAVQAEVFRLTSPERRAEHFPGASIRVFEDGDTYGVEIQKGGETYRKTYSDPARECNKRVRFTAVYAVMTLIPPDLSEEEGTGDSVVMPPPVPPKSVNAQPKASPDAVEQPAAAEPRAAPASEAPSDEPTQGQASGPGWLHVEASGWFQHSVSNSDVPRIAAFGGELLVMVGSERFAGVAAASLAPRSSFDIGDIGASTSEMAFRIGGRSLWRLVGVRPGIELAAVAARRRVQGELAGASSQSAWEWGALVGGHIAVPLSELVMPFVGVRASWFPAPTELEALPRGTIGTLPKLWLGAQVGLRFGW